MLRNKSKVQQENQKRKQEKHELATAPTQKLITKKGKGVGKKTIKIDPNTCCVCCVAWKSSGDVYPWIACDTCTREMHQRCVPSFHTETMQTAIDNKLDFVCHVCLVKKS
jgi:hypothetical protein